MSRIRGKDTKPERVVRKIVHALGYRYRLHRRDLPGTPDLVFVSRRRVINVHGCYWHSHNCRFGRVEPATNRDFWAAKRAMTTRRDSRNSELLAERGWRELIVWECEVYAADLADRVRQFLDSD